jgi:hypothetical protein
MATILGPLCGVSSSARLGGCFNRVSVQGVQEQIRINCGIASCGRVAEPETVTKDRCTTLFLHPLTGYGSWYRHHLRKRLAESCWLEGFCVGMTQRAWLLQLVVHAPR